MTTTKTSPKRKAPAKRKAAPKEVHRSLHLSTPMMKGADVKALQVAIAADFKHRKIDWLPIARDRALGLQTRHAAKFDAWALGLATKRINRIKDGTIDEATQRLLRDPSKRSRLDRIRERRRKGRLAKIRKAQTEGPAAAVAYARSFVGTTESPAGSNTGPTHTNAKGQKGGVSFWEAYWGLGACFWCLCFASYCAKAIGGAKIAGNCTFSVAIEGYARNHENGWVQVPVAQAKPGDISIWKFDGPNAPSDHGELIVAVSRGPKEDVGGNTSSEGGSQSNGGGVFAKTIGSGTRPLSDLSMVVRPLYG